MQKHFFSGLYTSIITLLTVITPISAFSILMLPQAAKAQDCGTKDGISLPCWRNYVGSGEGDESLPLYPYAKRPNGCSIPEGRPGEYDNFGSLGYDFSFTDVCNDHDRCYYTFGTTPSQCNLAYKRDLLKVCRDGIFQRLTPQDILTVGASRQAAVSNCLSRAETMSTAVIAAQSKYHSEAQSIQKAYLARVDEIFFSASFPVFDADFYLMSYGDLRNAFGGNQSAAKKHWLSNGINEGRRSSSAFDVRYYLEKYTDLQNAFGNSNYAAAVNHWRSNGISEGRRSSLVFDVRYYLEKYTDLQNAFGNSNYAAAVNHWLSNGIQEGRQGSPDFDPKFYLSNNPDVASAYGANNYKGAIEHFLEYGKGEGRRGTP